MAIDIIAFIVGILLGVFIYWRESNSNGVYRFVNKIMNSKELQMSPDNPKGFKIGRASCRERVYAPV